MSGRLPVRASVIGPSQRPPLALAVRPQMSRHRAAARSGQAGLRAGPTSEEGAVDKIDRGASRNAQVPAKRALPVNIEIAARLAARRQRRLRFEHTVLSVNDERHRPPIDEVAPDVGESRAGGRPCRRLWQKIEHDAERHAMTARDIVQHAVWLFPKRRPDRLEVEGRRCCCEVQAAASCACLFFSVWIVSKPSNSG
jgi:hypothetical protein